MTIVFSRGLTKFDSHPQRFEVPNLDAFAEKVNAWRQPTKGRGYVCAPFADGHRCKDSAEPSRLLALDLDRIDAGVYADVCMYLASFAGVGWPTHSSTPEAPRLRGFLLLDRAASRDELLRLGSALKAELEERFPGALKIDTSVFRPEQPNYLAPPKVELARWFGEAIAVDAWLAKPTAVLPAGESSKSASERADEQAETDPVYRALRERGALLVANGKPGMFNVLCPCADRHTSPSSASSTVYKMPRFDGRRWGAFQCLHEHCRGRDQKEFLEALGLDPAAVWREQAGSTPTQFSFGAGDDTPQPVDIFRTVAAPALDPSDFPALLQDLAVPLAKAAGHDPAAYLMAGLVAGAAATSDALRLLIDPDTSWFESARLWVLLLGAPGTAKTPAVRAGMAPLFELHRQLVERHEAALAALAEDEPKPPRPAIYTSDPTVEALSDVLVANPRGVIAVFEELDSWLGSHDAYRNGGGSKDRGEWLRLFDGGPHQVDRVKRGSVFVPNWGVSIIGATTPAGLKRHAKALPPDGLIQRFLPVLVRSMGAPTATLGERETIEPCRRRLAERMVELYNAPTGVVRLAPDAARMFAERRDQLRGEVEAVAAFSEPFAGHVAKNAGLIARVALTMHALTNGAAARETLLDAETMRGAIALVRKLTRHALAMFDMLGGGDDGALSVARAAARSIVAGNLTELTRRDLIHACRPFRDATDTAKEAALRFLVDAAWLTPLDGSRQYAGRATGYVVHPSVHVKFAAEGEELKARRSVVRELLAG